MENVVSSVIVKSVVSAPIPVGGNTLNDSVMNWEINIHKNRLVKVGGQLVVIEGNSHDTLLIRGSWAKVVKAGEEYTILGEDTMQMLRDVFGRGFNISTANPLQTYDPAMGLTTFTARTAVATNVNGVTWGDLLDMSILAKLEEIWSITLTMAGGWAGLCQLRIVDGTGTKIFPFTAYAEQNTDFFSGVQWSFPAPVVAVISSGYRIQFRSSNGADGAGQTCALTELAVVIRG